VVNDNVQQTSNAALDDPLPADARAYNDQGTKQTKSPTQSPRQEVSPASQSRLEILSLGKILNFYFNCKI
jgi:hypothetical protein